MPRLTLDNALAVVAHCPIMSLCYIPLYSLLFAVHAILFVAAWLAVLVRSVSVQQLLFCLPFYHPPPREPSSLFILIMRMYLLEKNLRLNPDLGPFWHTIPLSELRSFDLNRGRYIQLVPSPAPTGKPSGILYAFQRPSDHPDPKRTSTTVDLRKGSLVPVALFVKDATALWEAEEEVVRLWGMIEETKGVGMDPQDITKAHYGRAVLDFTAMTAAKSLPAPAEKKNGSRSAPAKPQVFSGKWPKCTADLINRVKKSQPWHWGAPTGPPPQVPGASSAPVKVVDDAYREMRTGSYLVAAKEQKKREEDQKAMEKAGRKPVKVAIAFEPHPSVPQPSKKQATLPKLFDRSRNSNHSITIPRTASTMAGSSRRPSYATVVGHERLPPLPVSKRHGNHDDPLGTSVPIASSPVGRDSIHDDGEQFHMFSLYQCSVKQPIFVVGSDDWPPSPVVRKNKHGQAFRATVRKPAPENATNGPATDPKPKTYASSPILISSDDVLTPLRPRNLPSKISVGTTQRSKAPAAIFGTHNKENSNPKTIIRPSSPQYISSDGQSSPAAADRPSTSRARPLPALRPSPLQPTSKPQNGVRGLSASMKIATSAPKRRRH